MHALSTIHPISKIPWLAISQKPISQPKINVWPSYICLHLSVDLWVKIQNTHCYRNSLTFLTSGKLALNGPAMISSKIQNRLSRACTVNSNTVSSKFHLIRSFCEIFVWFLSFHVWDSQLVWIQLIQNYTNLKGI